MRLVEKTILAFLLSILFVPLHGQQAHIEVLDHEGGKAISGVTVKNQGTGKPSNPVTDIEGKASINVSGKTIVTITVPGYESKLDTIYPGLSKKIYLKKKEIHLQEIVFTGQFRPQNADQSIYKVGVVSSEQIKSRAANNLCDLLSTNLNVRINQEGVLGSDLYIQGLSGEQVKILIDGVPVIGRQDGFIDLTQLSLYNVDHIEIIEGPMSVVYGSNAMAGAINIITKENSLDQFSASAKTYYESVGQYNVSAELSIHQNQQTFSFSGDRNFFGGYSTDLSKRSYLFNPNLQYDGNLSYICSIGKNRLKIKGTWFNEEYRMLGDLVSPNYEKATDVYYYTTRLNETADWRANFTKTTSLNVLMGHSTYQLVQNTFSNDLVTLTKTLTESSQQDTTKMEYLMMRTTYAMSTSEKFDFQAGTDLNFESIDGKREQGYKEIGDYAGFVNIKYSILPNLVFQPGARIIYNTRFSAPLIYSFHTRWDPSTNLTFRASYAKGFRSPSLKELYLVFRDGGAHNVTGNDTLKPEYSNSINTSASYHIQLSDYFLSCEFSVFYNHIKNKIDYLYYTSDATMAHLINLPGSGYKTKGLNLNLGCIWKQRFSINTGLDFLCLSKLPDNNQFFYNKNVTADVSYKIPQYQLKFSLFYKYNGEFTLYSPRYTGTSTYDASNIITSYISGFHTMNLSVSKSFLKETIDLNTGIKNIFNNKTIYASLEGNSAHSSLGTGNTNSASVGWGRTFFISLVYHFKK
jgi:outer membrane receptor for ferrienterochelin and colicins